MENLHYLCSEKGKNKKENTSYEAEFERTEKISPPAFKFLSSVSNDHNNKASVDTHLSQ